jgi:hypothetical protein
MPVLDPENSSSVFDAPSLMDDNSRFVTSGKSDSSALNEGAPATRETGFISGQPTPARAATSHPFTRPCPLDAHANARCTVCCLHSL